MGGRRERGGREGRGEKEEIERRIGGGERRKAAARRGDALDRF